jgi:hypothetical protein
MYFLASDHALRGGFPSKVLRFIFAPIPFSKTKTDVSAVKEMLRRLKAGACVCLFAEGDRSAGGVTGPVSISTAKLAKTSGAALITFRLGGGYFTHPRWAKTIRKGKMTGGVISRFSPAELEHMTDEQILGIIERDIYENAYEQQKENPVHYRGKNIAEHIETAMYLCPGCKRIGTIRSGGDRFSCDCGLDAVYAETGFLEGRSLPFSTITEWDAWQAVELEEIVNNAGDSPICTDESQQLFEVRTAEKTLVGEGTMQIDRKALHCAGHTFPIERITRFAVADQMLLLFALKDGTAYEVRSAAPRSALIYKEIFNILTKCG